MKRRKLVIASIIGVFTVVVLVVAIVIVYLLFIKDTEEQSSTQDSDQSNAVTNASDYRFADYELIESTVTPNVKNYTVEKDLSNVYYIKKSDAKYSDYANIDKTLSSSQKQVLATDNFIVTEGDYSEFFSLYEENRYGYIPNFITTDSVMHTYHLIFDATLKQLETDFLAVETKDMTAKMVTESQEQYTNATTDEMKQAAKRNIAYFSVAAKLIDPDFTVPDMVKSEVDAELTLIEAHSETKGVSPVMAIGFDNPNDLDNLKEDYTQYIPRGHYTKSDELKRYFKSMMWMGRITFLVKDRETSDSAFLITDILRNDADLLSQWDSIAAPITFFVGKTDDLGYYEFTEVLDEKLPNKAVVEASDEELNILWEEAEKLDPPQLNSIPIYDETIQPDREEETKGFRFFGQRFTLDANIFQNLIYRSVKANDSGDKKMLPSFIEIPAAMGDELAVDIIKEDEDYYSYPNYDSQMSKLQADIGETSQDEWTWNLYSSWLYTLNAQIGETPSGYPQFMSGDKWGKKELNTYSGSWTELKHDTILYSKQVYAEMGATGFDGAPDDKGYVEPNVLLWNRLLALVKMTRSGLEARGIIAETSHTEGCDSLTDYKEKIYCNLSYMENSVDNLVTISEKELEEKSLTADEYDFIRYFGGNLENMFMSTLEPGASKFSALDDNPAMLVADVATDPNGFALEEGTGYINNIYVIVPVEGKLRIARGGVYSQYEFVNDSTDRLTDEAWREMLKDGDIPEMTKWQQSLITE